MGNGTAGTEAQKREIGETLWLHYYNRVLFDKGVISEDERNRMSNRINARNGGRNDRRQRVVLT